MGVPKYWSSSMSRDISWIYYLPKSVFLISIHKLISFIEQFIKVKSQGEMP